MPSCRHCEQPLTDENWYASTRRSKSNICKTCVKRKQKEHYHGKSQFYVNRSRERRHLVKLEVFSHYADGGPIMCVNCGCDDIRTLSIDHINGGGGQHRRSIGNRHGSSFYEWLRSNNFPAGFQILCLNCQFIKRVENNEVRGRD